MAYRQTIVAGNSAPGSRGGNNLEAEFNKPTGIAINPTNGAIIVADTSNHCIRQIMDGVVSTIAGICTGTRTGTGIGTGPGTGTGTGAVFADGPAAAARFHYPTGIAINAAGDIYVADSINSRIRRIGRGDVDTFAGNDRIQTINGVGAAASFMFPFGLAFSQDGNDTLYVADSNSIRMIDREGVVARLAGGGGPGFADGRGAAARFREPTGIATNAAGVVFVADRDNNRIRRITNGVVDTLAGSGKKGFADGAGATAQFNELTGLTLDPATGHLLVVDGILIRTVDPLTGVVTTLTRVDIPEIEIVGGGILVKGIAVNQRGTIFLTVGNKIVELAPLPAAPLLPLPAASSSGGRKSARRYKSKRSRRSKRSAHSKRTRKN